jgi:hypothetical protein
MGDSSSITFIHLDWKNPKCSKIRHCRIMRGKYTELKDVD